jgi:hypothetical protein
MSRGFHGCPFQLQTEHYVCSLADYVGRFEGIYRLVLYISRHDPCDATRHSAL